MNPGEIRAPSEPVELAAGRERRRLRVESRSRRVIVVSSHYPFEQTNRRLSFDRAAAVGFRLDLPAGGWLRWAPGETRDVDLVRYAGHLGGSHGPIAGETSTDAEAG